MDCVQNRKFQYAVIGGGIAGVSCIEQILEIEPEAEILLVSASPVVKEVSNVTRLSKTLQDFIVVEKSLKSFRDVHQSVTVIQDVVINIQPAEKILGTKENGDFYYHKLCICAGAVPKTLFPGFKEVIGIRDTESVQDLTQRLSKARRVLLIGNGGIATELVYELDGVDIIWAVKDNSISAQYLDSGAAEFFIQAQLEKRTNTSKVNDHEKSTDDNSGTTSCNTPSVCAPETKPLKRMKYGLSSIDSEASSSVSVTKGSQLGSALGPDWHEGFCLQGIKDEKNVTIVYETECSNIYGRQEYLELLARNPDKGDQYEKEDWPVYGELTNGKFYGCDLIISATGVRPNCEWVHIPADSEKGIFVNFRMETQENDIYAAGDVCYPNWKWSRYWFHMKLWTQARQMGLVAGKSMVTADEGNTDNEPEFIFELFSHVTKFFGFKVVLLGLYNAQGLEKGSYEYLIRCTKNSEYIKVVLQDSRMKGAILIGETGLEETFENLILNQIDLSPFGEDLLNPDIDIEDYFD